MVPFAACGAGISVQGQSSYDEIVAERASLVFSKGHDLMPWFLE
jgi:hypothetical protein